MINRQEILYALALQFTKGVGSVTAKKIIQIYGSATQVYHSHQKNEILAGINAKLFTQLFKKESLIKADQELSRAEKNNLNLIYYKDLNYPKHLLNCVDAPIVLFKDGVIEVNKFNRIISVVGTRNMTNYGQDFCKKLIADLKVYDPLIVSGFAFGVDICAHTEALKNNLSTIAVLAHGFGTLYPKEHKKYYESVKNTGGFLSEFAFNDAPYKENFLKRNRIVAGMSQATIVVESAAHGGSLVTASLANNYYKDVFALPGRATDVYSKGCNALIKNHMASLITNADDLVKQLGWEEKKEVKREVIQPQLFVDLQGDEKLVYDFLADKAKHMDEISRDCSIPIYKIANIVFQLEMKGLIKVLPGKLIKRF